MYDYVNTVIDLYFDRVQPDLPELRTHDTERAEYCRNIDPPVHKSDYNGMLPMSCFKGP